MDKQTDPFAAGLTMVAGRALALVAYRDTERWGDRPLVRGGDDARGTVLALMPPACDGQGAEFRRRAARAFWDLAEDLAAGRAPLARCTAESWALQVMLEHAPRICAATDAELRAWGVAVPDGDADDYYPPDFDEQPFMFVIDSAETTIPEAQDTEDGGRDAEEDGADSGGGWSRPRYWFSPYGITVPRDPQRGHPDSVALASALPGPERAEELLHLNQGPAADRGDRDGRGHLNDDDQYPSGALAAILTPQAADLLAVAADHVADSGWYDLFQFGDRVVERPDDEEDEDNDWSEDSFLLDLPALCDGQSAAWRLAMVQAVENLAGDLRGRRAPIPTCTAEELAFHLILREAEVLLDYLDDDKEYARQVGLPPGSEFSARHRTLDLWRECFLQDEDVLMHYDERLQHVATDPDHPASRQLGTGDLRPRSWFTPFGNVRPRPVRRLDPGLRERLATADPQAFFDSTSALRDQPLPAAGPAAVLPEGLREEFETFVGLAQRRFFDEPTAIAMATSLDRLLTLFFSLPQVVPFRIWPLNPRASAVQAGLLIVDDDFCLRGLDRTWRLSADRSDGDARRWATELLRDCANYALNNWDRGPWDMLRGPDEPAPEPLHPALPDTLTERLRDLARDMTAAGLLRHRMNELALTTAELADLAVLPEGLVASWLDGAEASPSQIIRCAPALQLSEDVLLDAVAGKRDTTYWPLPQPPLDCTGRPERGAYGQAGG
ncbi:hypothetical protein [Streptomyces sp. HPF1205]|uniref:hypothetical protein n=1 Tax=Streptomyces sp. HPF1205 TaxID=2873262 RepID=UPI001CED1A7D|nr:hypothetical protein [Streptomyces sp. HPF1205]